MAIDFDFKNVLNPTGQVDNHVLRELLNDLKIYLNDTLETDISIQDGNIDSESATDGHVLTADGSGNSAFEAVPAPAAGKLLQVQAVTKGTGFSSSSTSFIAVTGLSLSITPSSTSSTILLLTSFNLRITDTDQGCFATLFRGGSNLGAAASGMAYRIENSVSGQDNDESANIIALDSPASTSSLTYQLYVKVANAGNTVHVNAQSGRAFLAAIEIGP